MKKPDLDVIAYESRPKDFNPVVDVSACYLEIDGKLLFVQRASHKDAPDTWGVPAGKVEPGESSSEAAVRELFEETKIHVNPATQVIFLGTLYMRKPHVDYTYHIFKVVLDHRPAVHLCSENQSFEWVSAQDIESKFLMPGAKEAWLFYCRKIS